MLGAPGAGSARCPPHRGLSSARCFPVKRRLGASRGSESSCVPCSGWNRALLSLSPRPAVPPSKPVAHVPSSATIGSKAVLRCTETDGSPPPTFRWYRDTMLMPSDPKTSLTFRNSSYTLDSTTGELVSAGAQGAGTPGPHSHAPVPLLSPSRPSSPSPASTPGTTTARPPTTWGPPKNRTRCTWKPVSEEQGRGPGWGLLRAASGTSHVPGSTAWVRVSPVPCSLQGSKQC